jgi:pimeloyl-ACP methyl ester carboxylesterase
LIVTIVIILSGCAFRELKKELEEIDSTVGLGGRIISPSPLQANVLVMLLKDKAGRKEIYNFNILEQEKIYLFLVPPGRYYLFAFEDLNNNIRYDDGELAGYVDKAVEVNLSRLRANDTVDIVLAKDLTLPEGFPGGLEISNEAIKSRILFAGRIIDLDDEIFSLGNAQMGFWKPLSFAKRFGVGVYFLGPYDADKIPIVFVHGAAGSPKHFQYIIENLDRKKYQPWVFYYPSGISLRRISSVLDYLIQYLHDKYEFPQLYVTAHSMGGLVARGFIVQNFYQNEQDYIKLFVSISTPWGGLESARRGVERAPAAIPSWHDMVPDSPFIKYVFSQQLTPNIEYYLLFGFKGDCSMFMENNDGSITIKSQLEPRAQQDAIFKWGFDRGHVPILSSSEVFEKYKQILDNTRIEEEYKFNLFGVTE